MCPLSTSMIPNHLSEGHDPLLFHRERAGNAELGPCEP
jgi:hypothetical protein